MDKPEIYTSPDSHDEHIKQMVIWLAVGFSALLIIVIFFIFFADRLAKQLPFSAEEKFVKSYESMAGYFFDEPVAKEQEEIERYLSDLVADLSVKMNIPKNYALKVHYMNNGTVNAFATLGGHVFIFRGLIEAMPNENSLAMVVAHELAHIKHRDPLAAMGRGFALQLVYSFATGDYSSGLGLGVEGSELGLLYFSREQESIADIAAADALAKHYGHVQGYDTFFRHILEELDEDEATEQSVSHVDEWLATHPNLKKRIEQLHAHAKEQDYLLQGEVLSLPAWLPENIETLKRAKEIKDRAEKLKQE